MKKLIIFFVLLSFGFVSVAQQYYQDAVNEGMLRHADYQGRCRKEIVLPQVVNAYNVYKADLHTHTIYSDGVALPKYRVMEAWLDGLDVLSITDHIEFRPHEMAFTEYLEEYMSDQYKKAVNTNITRKAADSNGILVDLNQTVKDAVKVAADYGITVIPGAEITRKTEGDFNVLFTTDNNLIYDPDPVQSVRNAKVQGAVVMHNHPGKTRRNLDCSKTERILYDEGLIDGVEVMNGAEFYPEIIDRVREKNLFIAANTDIHLSTAVDYRLGGICRPMTLIFAEDNTLPSLKEALCAARTLSYGFNTICGDESLLKDFFVAGVTLKTLTRPDKTVLLLTNNTSVSYVVQQDGANQVRLEPFSTISIKVGKDEETLRLTILNMFFSKDAHPVVELSF